MNGGRMRIHGVLLLCIVGLYGCGGARSVTSSTEKKRERPVYFPFEITVGSPMFSPDGKLVLVGCDLRRTLVQPRDQFRYLRVYEVESGKELSWYPETIDITCREFLPDGNLLVASHEDKPLRVWNPRTGKDVRALEGLPGRVKCLAVSDDGKLAVTGCYEGEICTLKVWNLQVGRLERDLDVGAEFDRIQLSPDGKLVAARVERVTSNGTELENAFKVFDLTSGELLWKRGIYDGWSLPGFLQDGKQALVGYQLPERLEKPSALLCQARTGQLEWWLPVPERERTGELAREWAGADFRRSWADDKRLMAIGEGILWTWDLDKREAITAVRVATKEERSEGYDWTFTRDGRILCLTSGRDIGPSRWNSPKHGIKVKIADTATGKVIHELNCENILVNEHDP